MTKPVNFDKLLYTPVEAAHALGLSRSTIYVLVANGRVPSVRTGNYEVNVRRHNVPVIGNRTLAKLSPADVQGLINIKRGEGPAPSTVPYVHATLRAAPGRGPPVGPGEPQRRHAGRAGVGHQNSGGTVRARRVQRHLGGGGRGPARHLLHVALAVGLRPSEALGLKWADVDLSEGLLRVPRVLERRGKEKSRTSRRTIPPPRVCVDQLTAHRHRQLFERRSTDGCEKNDLVFCTPVGTPLDRTEVSRRLLQAPGTGRRGPPPALRLPPHRRQLPARPGCRPPRRHGSAWPLLFRSNHGHIYACSADAHARRRRRHGRLA